MGKFCDPAYTLDRKHRASVSLTHLQTLWFNTGTMCNLACANCYIESSPRNDRLTYLSVEEVRAYLREALAMDQPVREIGFTGGEPFLNPEFIDMLQSCLEEGFDVLVLTNAMRPMMKNAEALLKLNKQYKNQLIVRMSIDHYRREVHELERGPRSWLPMLKGLHWLYKHDFNIRLAGRLAFDDDEDAIRAGFQHLLHTEGIEFDASDPQNLVLFPEIESSDDTPEITTECWDILGVPASDLMCASSRMVVKHKGDSRPKVVSCTLLPYEPEFSLGYTLADASVDVFLNHPSCSKFCVLGGGNCSG